MPTNVTIEHKGKSQTLDCWPEQWAAEASLLDTCLVVGPGYYGYGESIKVAKQNCIKAGCDKGAVMHAYLGDSSLGVTGMGLVKAEKILIDLGQV